MNKVILIGRLCADPELKTTQNGTNVCTVRLAVNRRFANEDGTYSADFFDVVCWQKTAEFMAKHFNKGRQLAVVGRLQTRSWTDKDGGKRYATEVVADELHFADSKTERHTDGAAAAPEYTPATRADLEEADDDDDAKLPF